MEPNLMSTVVRIKRRIGTETSESIIVSAKRARTDVAEENPVADIGTTILKKLTTIENIDSIEIQTKHALQKHSKFENSKKHSGKMKQNYKQGICSTAKDLIQRKSKNQLSQIRFKLICSKRKLEDSKPSDKNDIDFHLLDATEESEEPSTSQALHQAEDDVITCNGVPMEREKISYVYDLYYTSSLPFELSNWIDNICQIQKVNALEYRHDSSSDTNADGLTDDENEENNWRNDYPDEDGEEEDSDGENSGREDFFDDDENEENNWRNYYIDKDGEEEDSDDDEDSDDYRECFDDEDDLCNQLRKTRIKDSDSTSSYDLDEYIESSDFDAQGGIISHIRSISPVIKTESSRSESD